LVQNCDFRFLVQSAEFHLSVVMVCLHFDEKSIVCLQVCTSHISSSFRGWPEVVVGCNGRQRTRKFCAVDIFVLFCFSWCKTYKVFREPLALCPVVL